MQLWGAVSTVAESKQKTDEDSKAGGKAPSKRCLQSLTWKRLKNSPGQQGRRDAAGSYSFALLRYLWLLFYGTVKAYHDLEVDFTLRRMIVLLDCVLRHFTHGSCTTVVQPVCCNFEAEQSARRAATSHRQGERAGPTQGPSTGTQQPEGTVF